MMNLYRKEIGGKWYRAVLAPGAQAWWHDVDLHIICWQPVPAPWFARPPARRAVAARGLVAWMISAWEPKKGV